MGEPDVAREKEPDAGDPFPARPFVTRHRQSFGGRRLAYEATADWITLRKKGKPLARIFHVAYVRTGSGDRSARPITFVFNGGPGAASAYLHMGAVGPRRVAFGAEGTIPSPPARVVDNAESWLAFTDLVFVDPVGTGFSRPLDRKSAKPDDRSVPSGEDVQDRENPEFWEVERDLEALGEFIQTFLSRRKRWGSPVFLAGESYGGFRTARLARKVQERFGVGLNGVILISPAIEFGGLLGTDYDMTRWIDLFPSQAAVAHFHRKGGRSRLSPEKLQAEAEAFATDRLLPWLARGEALGATRVREAAEQMGALIGIPADTLATAGGRIDTNRFCRLLLRAERKLVGRYDGSATASDPFPDREEYAGPDPTLASIDRLFTAGINQHLRQTLGVETDLDYRLLSMDVYESWKFHKGEKHFPQPLGAMDDLRYGMSLNADMRVFVTHGLFDLVTPYFATNRLAGLMKLTPDQRVRLTIRHFKGGHMFYSWDASRRAFTAAVGRFFREATTRV